MTLSSSDELYSVIIESLIPNRESLITNPRIPDPRIFESRIAI